MLPRVVMFADNRGWQNQSKEWTSISMGSHPNHKSTHHRTHRIHMRSKHMHSDGHLHKIIMTMCCGWMHRFGQSKTLHPFLNTLSNMVTSCNKRDTWLVDLCHAFKKSIAVFDSIDNPKNPALPYIGIFIASSRSIP